MFAQSTDREATYKDAIALHPATAFPPLSPLEGGASELLLGRFRVLLSFNNLEEVLPSAG